MVCLQARCASAENANFYEGKTIDFIIGGDAGGGYDLYARLIARFLPEYIRGKPIIVPRNMPGAGSANAASTLYNTLPRDGTAIAALFPGGVVGPLLDSRFEHQYDPSKFEYLASAVSDTRVCITWGASKVKTYKDALQETASMGASAPGASTTDYANMHIRTTGAKFKVVTGYKGTVDIFLAMERGEVDGMCGIDWSSLKSQRPEWLQDKKVNILVQDGLKPDPELTKLGVPVLSEFIKNKPDEAAVDLILSQQSFSRPYVAPPGTPSEQVAILRKGFAESLVDPALISQAKSGRLTIAPISGEEVQSIVAKVYGAGSETVSRAKQLVAP
jgi:tripartite-type tricarboxylate transporter receptor subunit TctC